LRSDPGSLTAKCSHRRGQARPRAEESATRESLDKGSRQSVKPSSIHGTSPPESHVS
jgi:hypothetical protein